MQRVLASLAPALLATACGASAADSFRQDGFHHQDYPYRVSYANAGGRQLLPTDWRLDNFYLDDGEPDDLKEGPDYVYSAEFDRAADGDVDDTAELYLYDLRFEHEVHDGVIWLRTFPISRTDMRKDLGILARKHLAVVSGVGVAEPVFEEIARGVRELHVEERRYATRVLESASATVGRARAFRVTFDVFNLDQMEVDPDTPVRRVRMYFIRPPFVWEHPDGATGHGSVRGRWPALMTFGYSNHADRFDEALPTFEDLVGRLGFERGDYDSGIENVVSIRAWRRDRSDRTDGEPWPEDEWDEDDWSEDASDEDGSEDASDEDWPEDASDEDGSEDASDEDWPEDAAPEGDGSDQGT